jgi:hypothetical protein
VTSGWCRCAAVGQRAQRRTLSRSGSIEIISTRRSARCAGVSAFSVARSVSMISGQAAGQLA